MGEGGDICVFVEEQENMFYVKQIVSLGNVKKKKKKKKIEKYFKMSCCYFYQQLFSGKLSAVCMKCQNLFSGKNAVLKFHLLLFKLSRLTVNP